MANLEDALKGTYTSKDCEFALQHGAFTNFRRDLTRHKRLYFPRKVQAGPGGGQYRYAHIFEMAIHMAVGSHRDGNVARSVVWGMDRQLRSQHYGCEKLNQSSPEIRQAILCGASDWEDEDFQEQTPQDAHKLVDFPTFYLNEDFISRDPENPTFVFYNPSPHSDSPCDLVLSANTTLLEAQEKIFRLRTQGLSDERHYDMYREYGADLSVLNLTTMLQFIDERLKLRIAASQIRGM